MPVRHPLSVDASLSSVITVENGGLFISTGDVGHPQRRLASFELILVRDGCLRISEESSFLSVRAGEIIILHPGRSHRGVGKFPADLAFYWLHFRMPASVSRKLRLPALHKPARRDRIAELFHWFLDDQENACLSESRARLIVLLILEELNVTLQSKNRSDSRLAKSIEEVVLANFSQRLRLRDISARLGFNGDYLDLVFRKARGKTIAQFIRDRRIEEAKWMLLKTSLQIKEVSARCGFSNAAHFTRSFAEATGILPSRFQKVNSDAHINIH